MTTTSLPQDPSAIVSEVESFFAELPAKRRRRTKAEIYEPDQSEETENYDKPSLFDALTAGRTGSTTDDPAWALILAWEIQGRVAMLYRSVYRTPDAKSAKEALPDLVTQLMEMAGGNMSEELTDRAVAIFNTLEWERRQAILFAMAGRFFATEASWVQWKNGQK